MRDKVFIIAEAGVNHNGDIRLAKKLIDAAARAGADAVKFQTFNAEALATAYAPKARYQKAATGAAGSQYVMLKKLELDAPAHRALMSHCRKKGIAFMSSAFDAESIELLRKLGLATFKIPSGELTNLPYLRKIGGLKKRVIMSAGMASLDEIKKALAVLAAAGTPSSRVTVMQCVTDYPAPYRDARVRAMVAMKQALGVEVGYSDHTPGIEVAIAAAALGARVIEKHFTLDRRMPGPDHKASLEPDQLAAMVAAIRHIELALGDPAKRPSRSERENRIAARKSIVAARAIRKGEILSEASMTTKRPATGISPMAWDRIVGRRARQDFMKDELITL